LLDEPTSALDQNSVDVLLTLLKKVKQDHIILLISHDPKVVEAADHIVEL
jgi:ABC transporter related